MTINAKSILKAPSQRAASPSATGGGCSEVRLAQRSKNARMGGSPKRFSGTARGMSSVARLRECLPCIKSSVTEHRRLICTSLMAPLCKGSCHFRKKMTEGLWLHKRGSHENDNPSVGYADSPLYTRGPLKAHPKH